MVTGGPTQLCLVILVTVGDFIVTPQATLRKDDIATKHIIQQLFTAN